MTEIFEAISLKLWRKDIHRLHAKSESECRRMNINRVKEIMGKHMDLLEALAFSGLYNDILDFDSNYRNKVYDHFGLSVTEFLIESLSFLRTSDPSVGKNNQHWKNNHHYHFLHLTFQEYFAARYFVQQWKSNQPLCCTKLNKRGCTEIETANFLQENKYEPRYNVFWRFVAGLLSVNGEALSFFKAVEKKPRDILGPTHQYLVMHCLSEVRKRDPTFAAFRTKLEKTLKRWLLFECRLTKECYLASEMECPEQVLTFALKQASEDERIILLRSLHRRAATPSNVLHLIVPWLDNSASTELKIAILDFMKHQHKNLPGEMLQRIGKLLDDEDFHIQWAAARTLQGQSNLTNNLSQRIAALLEDMGQGARRITSVVPQFPASLTNKLMQRIPKLLGDEDKDMQEAVLRVMQGQAYLTEDLLEHIARLLTDKEYVVSEAAARVFHCQINLTDGLLQRIPALLENNKDKNVQEAVLGMLKGQDNLTDGLLQCVVNALDNKELLVQRAAVRVIHNHTNLTENLLQRIAALLVKNDDKNVQVAVLEALQGQENLTDKLLQCVKNAFKAEDLLVRWAAVRVFQGRANLTENLLEPIPGLLIHEEYSIREIALEVVLSQTALSLDSLGKDKSSFFQVLVVKSFKEYLYYSDESFIGTGSRRVPLICKRKNQVRDEILKLQKNFGVSLPNTEGTTYVPTPAEASLGGEIGVNGGNTSPSKLS
jgi:hypothetical protein